MLCHSNWEYFIAKDEFQINFPEGDYDIGVLVDWYRVIPTKSENFSYYGDNIEILKDHFSKFTEFGDVKTKMNNDMHSNHFLTVWCLVIYNSEHELVGFSAQEYIEGKPADKKILYFNELNDKQSQYYINLDM